LNRLVALKILAPEKGAEPKFAERFQREAQALARLSHPNIVAVYDYGEADGMFFLLMEYVDGMTLRQLLREGRMKPEEALAIVPPICEALQFAHEQGIVHRDIKPENVLLDKQGRVKIADFGIAKLIGADQPHAALTEERSVIGTPHYMAPEQVEQPHRVDHRADIYSLGVVFYEMLTGELPLGKFHPPSTKIQLDVRLDEVVLRTLEKEPDRRYQQVSEVKTDVEMVSNPTISSRNVNRRSMRTTVVGITIAVLLIAVGGGLLAVAFSPFGKIGKIVSAITAVSNPSSPLSFGPVIERVITVGNGFHSYYGLDRGVYVPAPPDLDASDTDRFWKWLTEHNVDLFALRSHGRPVLALSDMVTAVLNETDFDRISPEEVRHNQSLRTVLAVNARPNQQSPLSGAHGGKITLAFQTRYEVLGVLQVLGPVNDPAGVQIRYKLIRQSPTSSFQSK
jgi:serine/threonine protein kinase